MAEKKNMFRDLKANEIIIKAMVRDDKEIVLVLYKDARVDMAILDETVKPYGWQRKYPRGNDYCEVSIKCPETQEWITKGDYGAGDFGSNADKGVASDSFKRACFNWGIGIELYTSPSIRLPLSAFNVVRGVVKDTFEVSTLVVEDKKIVSLEVVKSEGGKVVFSLFDGKVLKIEFTKSPRVLLTEYAKTNGIELKTIAQQYKLNGKSVDEDFARALEGLQSGKTN